MRAPPVFPRLRAAGHRQGGFSLIEIMVGLVIAMMGVIIMMEVLITSEERTRSTNTGNDATSSGAVMMHLLQRDVMQAGYGINTLGLLNCQVKLPSGASVLLAPVTINPASFAALPAPDANTDSLLVVYGDDNGEPEGNTAALSPGTNDYSVQYPSNFNVNDYVIAWPGSCPAGGLTLEKVTKQAGSTVTVDAGLAGASALYNLGQAPRVVGYMVRNGALTSCDFMAHDCKAAVDWTAVAGNIVSLRAQYGRDTASAGSMDGQVDRWDQTTPSNVPATPSIQCKWARIPAVRFALVARSTQYETQIDPATGKRVCNQVTTATNAPTWSGSTGASTAPIVPPFAGTTAADWQCYRYRTFENIAPARNIVWMGIQAGC